MDYTDLVELDYESVFLCFFARVNVCTYKSVYVCEFVCLCVCFYLSVWVCARARVGCKRKYVEGPPNLRGGGEGNFGVPFPYFVRIKKILARPPPYLWGLTADFATTVENLYGREAKYD